MLGRKDQEDGCAGNDLCPMDLTYFVTLAFQCIPCCCRPSLAEGPLMDRERTAAVDGLRDHG